MLERARLAAILAVLTITAPPAFAELSAVQSVEREEIVEGPDGAPRIVRRPAERVAPGDEVIYLLRYENPDAAPAADVVLVMAVPGEVDYVENSVVGDADAVSFSADGGRTYVARGRLTVLDDGVERAARGEDITHIRWTLDGPLPAGAAGAVSYRAILK